MDREEWIRNYGSKGLKGDILVRVSYILTVMKNIGYLNF